MSHMFRNKKISILLVALTLVVLILLCMLLITLTQMSSLKQRTEKLQSLIDESKKQGEATQELIEFMKTDEYVKRWAESNGRISKDDILWITNNVPNE